MSPPRKGTVLDGFRLGDPIHSGAMATLHTVDYADARASPFPMVMKIPRLSLHNGSETIVSFEVEHMILQRLGTGCWPRFVAAGDLARTPFLVMEHLAGQNLDQWMQAQKTTGQLPSFEEIAQVGALIADALENLHQQGACHLDLKPANLIRISPERIALLDFGLSWHQDLPDLLAEEMRPAIGSPTWISPEQIVGTRGDPRSDLFALGVILYELTTGRKPFGSAASPAGMRRRLWLDPTPPRAIRPQTPDWLQEVILRCLEPHASDRYPSARVLAYDLRHPAQVKVTARGVRLGAQNLWTRLGRWIKASGRAYEPSPVPSVLASAAPIVMVAVPHRDATDQTLYALRQATARALGTRPGARLSIVTVIHPSSLSDDDPQRSETALHRRHLDVLQRWSRGIDLTDHQMSCHVLHGSDVAQALLRYAQANHVDLMILGAATHGLSMQRLIATVPIRVATSAPCTVILVKEPAAFSALQTLISGPKAPT